MTFIVVVLKDTFALYFIKYFSWMNLQCGFFINNDEVISLPSIHP